MKNKVLTLISIMLAFALLPLSCKKEKKHAGLLTDIDGNTYKTVVIGDQLWMAENLKATSLNDGTEIAVIADSAMWENLSTPAFCWYNNDAASFSGTYGALYNAYTINTGKLCPAGWHIPEKKEWLVLREFLGDSVNGGAKLKETGTIHWLSPNKGATNSSGFTALGAGIRYFEGTFASILSYTAFWSATETGNDEEWYIGLYYAKTSFIMDFRNKKHGFSIRCLKD
jgi:uncharacterized protein (TIGR02145 family)